MKQAQASGVLFLLAVASGMASKVVNVPQSKPTKVTDAKKTDVAVAKPAVVAAANASMPLLIAGRQDVVSSIVARSVKPMATVMKRAAKASAPVHPEAHPMASTRRLLMVGLSTKVKVEAVGKRTLDLNWDCIKHGWNGCSNNTKADIVDGESSGNLRGAESAMIGEASHSSTTSSAPKVASPTPPPPPPIGVRTPYQLPELFKGSATGWFRGFALTAALVSLPICVLN